MLAIQEDETPVNPISTLYHALNAPMRQVNNLIADQLASHVPLVTELAKHLVISGGKRLRPLLTLATHGLFLDAPGKAIHLAAAVELIHTATLLHDDVVDTAEKRRGQESANFIWGNSASVLVGDFLFSKAFELMVETNNIEVLKCLSCASSCIAEGEVLQLTHLGDVDIYDIYLKIISAKTAALFSAACESGALLAGAPAHDVAALKDFGLNLGIAFQIMDDVLDYTTPSDLLGKPNGADFWEGKVTLPVLLAYSQGLEQDFWKTVFLQDNRTQETWDKVQSLLIGHGVFESCIAIAKNYATQAAQSLSLVSKQGPLLGLLNHVALYASQRRN